MRPFHNPAALIAVALLFSAGSALAADPPAPTHNDCFLSRDWDGWTAPGAGDALLIRVRMRDVYRVELTPGSRARKDPDNFLVNRVRGSSWICSPLDLDLEIADHHGFRMGLIARSIRKLTPTEIAAIPKRDLP